MIDGVLVVDATVHGFNFRDDNMRAPFINDVTRMLYHWVFDSLNPLGDRRWHLTFDQFQGLFDLQPDLMAQVLFAESAIDIACYHGVPMYGFYGDGSSPIHVAEAIAARLPHRMFIYADLSPTHPDPDGWIDSFTANPNVIGVKFYPVDMVDGQIRSIDLADERDVMPLIARLRDKGIRVIAVHKAVPLGPINREHYHVRDMAPVIEAFPDMQFEIVHGGFAFADETASLLERYPNVAINLESLPCFAVNFVDKLSEMLEPLLRTGRHDRIFFSTGATGMHPQPFIEAFWQMRTPHGFTRLTDEMKAGILGANFARFHGWDVAALKSACAADAYGLDKVISDPWGMVRERLAA